MDHLSLGKHQIKGSSRNIFFLQKIIATGEGSSILLMHLERVLFPSIHWKMAFDSCSILGCLSTPLFTESQKNGVASMWSHVKSRLTNSSSSIGTDPRHVPHCYELLTNTEANHEYTRLTLNRGLAVCKESNCGRRLRGKGDSSLAKSIDNKKMVRNLCFSQKYFLWTHFLTFTCNKKHHFGTSNIKN